VSGAAGAAGPVAACYLAAEGFEAEVVEELRRAGARVAAWHGRLALSPDPPVASAWALEAWTAPRILPAPSVKAAADALRALQRNWALYDAAHHRRAALVAARLPPVKARPLVFPEPAPAAHLGAWTLLAPDRLLASPTKTSPFVNGEVRFVEDREGPPSRAYLKLWEALTRLGRWPVPGETCLDLGAAPGGWSWALARLGAGVTAVDKAPLDPVIAALPGVAWRSESAFALHPRTEPPVDWLFSDVVCYPARLLALVRRWIAAGTARHLVCTVKFQGETDHAVAAEFAAVPGAVLFHGAHNKHELTFARLGGG
jgi:23S rRNA (cytidine2498-2'-O)-methyltransferase